MKNIFVIASLFCLTLACGGGNGTGRSVDFRPPTDPSTDSEGGNTGESGEPSEGANSFTAGEMQVVFQNGRIATIITPHGDRNVEYEAFFTHSVFSERYIVAANAYKLFGVDGENVDLGYLTRYRRANNNEHQHFIQGEFGTLPQSGVISYSGIGAAAMVANLESHAAFRMIFEADFNSMSMEGWSVPYQGILHFEGTINGNSVDGFAQTHVGTFDFTGHFFGDNAAEFGAIAENGGAILLLYGEYDPARTDAINQ